MMKIVSWAAFILISVMLQFPVQAADKPNKEEIPVVVIVGNRYQTMFDGQGRSAGFSRSAPPQLGGGGSSAPKAPYQTSDDSGIECPKVTGNPVIVTTGEKLKEEVDFVVQGSPGMGLTRLYRSKGVSGNLFGTKWMSSFDFPKLTLSRPFTSRTGAQLYRGVVLTKPDGSRYSYTSGYIDEDGRTVWYVGGHPTWYSSSTCLQ